MGIILPSDWTGSFHTVETDFPWQYRDRGYNGFETVQEYRIHCPYPTMSQAEILECRTEILRIAKPQWHFYCWTTKDFLPDAFKILEHYGSMYRQIFTWVKCNKQGLPTYGMGYWGRNACEYLVFGTSSPSFGMLDSRKTQSNWIFEPEQPAEGTEWEVFTGSSKARREVLQTYDLLTRDGDVFMAPRTRHSRKPDSAYDMMAALSPGPRASLFQRQHREGWENWGGELPNHTMQDVFASLERVLAADPDFPGGIEE